MQKLLAIIIFTLLCGCAKQLKNEYHEVPTEKATQNVSYTISYDSTNAYDIKHFYNLRSSTKQLRNKTYTLFYNKKVDYYFDLCDDAAGVNCKRIRPLFIDSAFIKGAQTVYAVYLHNFDSLFAITEKNIYLFDTAGKVINAIPYIESKNAEYKNYELNFDQNEKPFYFSNITKSLYISVFNNTVDKGPKEILRKNIPIILQYNLLTGKWAANKLQISELFREREYYIASQYFTSFSNNNIALTFEIDPNIYLYNIIADTVTAMVGKSAYADSIPQGFNNQFKYSYDELFSWFTRIPRYESQLLYDPYRHCYYRIFFKAIGLKNAGGLYNTQWDKTPVLMVFNEEFKLLKEIELPPGKIVAKKPFVAEKGLYIDLRTMSENAYKTYMVIHIQ